MNLFAASQKLDRVGQTERLESQGAGKGRLEVYALGMLLIQDVGRIVLR